MGIYGVVSVLILQLFGNIRRERHLTDTVKHFKYAVAVIGKLGYPVAALGIVDYLGCQNARKVNLRTDLKSFAGLHHNLPAIMRNLVKKQELHCRTRFLLYAVKSCRENL